MTAATTHTTLTLAGLDVPVIEVTGARPGPRLTVIAGVHGCEYSSIEAARRFAGTLDSDRLAGRVVVLPVLNVPAFWGRTPFVVPVDGKNLNRCFPGDPEGSFAGALAHEIFERYICQSDALLDLHGGDMVEALEPFTLYDPSPVEDRSRAMAAAFGLRYVIRMEEPDEFAGMTSTAAAGAGIPAIIAEAGDRGQVDPGAVGALVAGARNVAAWMGMLLGEPFVKPEGLVHVRRSTVVRSGSEGWWEPSVPCGSEVRRGQRLGAVRDLFGAELENVASPDDGVVFVITTSPAVRPGDLLIEVGGDLEAL
jgi:hypothetical protein